VSPAQGQQREDVVVDTVEGPLPRRLSSNMSGEVAAASVETAKTPSDQLSLGHSPMFNSVSTGPRMRSEGRRDSCSSLSAMGAETLYAGKSHHEERRRLPLLLTVFVCLVAGMSGLVVSGVHYALYYSGCPLGINGCNQAKTGKDVGFLLPRWVHDTAGDRVPESIVYVVVALAGAIIYAQLVTRLPGEYLYQMCGGGTLQSLVAVACGERIPLGAALLRILCTSLYLGSGGTLGGEGPAIQVCTSVAMFVGWVVGIRAAQSQSLLACIGISCGFAASFNSPLAGILFAMEELQHVSPSLSKTLICCILIASVVATSVLRASHGNTQLFKVKWHERSESSDDVFGSLWMLIAVPIGLLCSCTGAVITLSVRWLHRQARHRLRSWPYTVLFTAQAFLVAAIGAAVFHATGLRGVWGIGAGSLQEAFNAKDGLEAWVHIVFALGKAAAMILAVVVRAPGDVLEPVLLSGGFLGGFVGRVAAYALALPSSEIMAPCVSFGMVAHFAACLRFPLTPVVIVLEFTGIESYAIILPTALASFTAITASSRLCRPLLDELMHEHGIDLEEMAEQMAAMTHAPEEEEEEGEMWVDPTADPEREPSQAAMDSTGIPRQRRPSRCFVNMEELLNECANRNGGQSSCDGSGPVRRFRERSNSIGSFRSVNSQCSPMAPVERREVQGPPSVASKRCRSNSITSAGSHPASVSSANALEAAAGNVAPQTPSVACSPRIWMI